MQGPAIVAEWVSCFSRRSPPLPPAGRLALEVTGWVHLLMFCSAVLASVDCAEVGQAPLLPLNLAFLSL